MTGILSPFKPLDLDAPDAGSHEIVLAFLRDQRLMRESDLRALTGWTAKTAEAMRARGQAPPHVKAGKTVLFHFDDVGAWMRPAGFGANAVNAAISEALLGSAPKARNSRPKGR